ncbi:MAG TPA: dihydrolipoyl dehydrogenase, partial [Acetobacteraceae bacterium]
SRKVATQLSNGVKFLLKKYKCDVIDGEAKFKSKNAIVVTNKGQTSEYQAKNFIIATGARARSLPGLEPDGKLIWTYKEAMVPPSMPKSLLVIGSGAIGIEFASFYRNMGADVTVVEVLPRILPVEDAEISAFAHKAFEKQGIRIMTGANVKGAKKGRDNVTVSIEANGKSQDIVVDRVISAVGIVGNVEGIGLEGTGVKVDRTHVVIDEYCRTGEPGVYAIGDLVGPPWLAHKASHEGVLCVEKIAGRNDVHPLNVANVPGCTYCRPQVASVGLTEARAKELGHEVKVGHFPFIGNGKAIAMGEPEGMVKTVFDAQTGELLGAHMVGAEVTEMIQGFVVARTLESTEAELIETIFPHPTISETMHEAVLDAYGRVIHI